jgi:hypothetical protein
VVDLHVLVLAGTAVLLGALVQGAVGLGVGLVAAPVVTLLDPTLMPVSLLVAGFILPALMLAAEREHIDRRVGWVLAGRLLGTAPGVWALSVLSTDQLAAVVGALVLVGVALTVRTFAVPVNRSTLTTAGFVSGVGATAASIGGPPLALVYQHEHAARLRSTLALVFALGSLVSLVALALAGQVQARALWAGIGFLPFLAAGLGLSVVLRSRLAGTRFRAAVLVVVSVSALAALTQGLWR